MKEAGDINVPSNNAVDERNQAGQSSQNSQHQIQHQEDLQNTAKQMSPHSPSASVSLSSSPTSSCSSTSIPSPPLQSNVDDDPYRGVAIFGVLVASTSLLMMGFGMGMVLSSKGSRSSSSAVAEVRNHALSSTGKPGGFTTNHIGAQEKTALASQVQTDHFSDFDDEIAAPVSVDDIKLATKALAYATAIVFGITTTTFGLFAWKNNIKKSDDLRDFINNNVARKAQDIGKRITAAIPVRVKIDEDSEADKKALDELTDAMK